MSHTVLSVNTDTHFDTPEPRPSSRPLPAGEGGGEMNVVAIEAMIGLMDAMDHCKSFKAIQSLMQRDASRWNWSSDANLAESKIKISLIWGRDLTPNLIKTPQINSNGVCTHVWTRCLMFTTCSAFRRVDLLPRVYCVLCIYPYRCLDLLTWCETS